MAIVLNKIILGHGMIVTFIIIFHVLNTTSFQKLCNFSSLPKSQDFEEKLMKLSYLENRF
jgi:hypothetical protein